MGLCFIKEYIDRMNTIGCNLYDIMEEVTNLANGDVTGITEEADFKEITHHLNLEVLDTDKFIKVNEWQEVTNPIFYDRPGQPSEDGLLSYKIFGITQDEKQNIFAYIDLSQYFLHPLAYKAWVKVNPKIKDVIAKLDTYVVDQKGNIVSDPKGSNGIDFLRKNIDKIKFEETGKIKKDIAVRFLELNRQRKMLFINKLIVIPPFYRDTNSSSSTKGSVGVGKINQLYQSVLQQVNGLKTNKEYGFDMSGAQDFRLQETLVTIYDWYCGNTNSNIAKDERGFGLSGKLGIYRMANASKTSDYGARLVITGPELKANSPKDMKVNFEKSLVPLSAVIACFAPFIQFAVRRFFQQEFMGTEQIPVVSDDGKVVYKKLVDPMLQFSDDVIRGQMDQFIHGYNNRFIPVTAELTDGTVIKLQFKGTTNNPKEDPESVYNRPLTWVDVLYMAAVEVTANRMVLISRYPVDTRANQITTKVEVATTNETEPMYVGDRFYKYYPKIDASQLGMDTSNMFIDTLNLSNLYCLGMGADYDGDTVTVRGVFTDEANDELSKFLMSKKNFIGSGGRNLRVVDSDTVQAIYSFTKILPADESKLTKPKF